MSVRNASLSCVARLCWNGNWGRFGMRASMRLPLLPGYKRELLAERGLVEFFNPRWAETNMVSSLARAEEWLVADTCIVSYADIFYESSAVRLLMN